MNNLFGFLLIILNIILQGHCFAEDLFGVSMDPYDLCKKTGLCFECPVEQAFKIWDTNDNNESVGYAFLEKNKKLAWFWSPSNGFEVIATKEILMNHRDDFFEFFSSDNLLRGYQFGKLRINNNGVVAGSIDIFEAFETAISRKYYWYWWSEGLGLQISSSSLGPTYVADINNLENVLLTHPNTHASMVNIHGMDWGQLRIRIIKHVKDFTASVKV